MGKAVKRKKAKKNEIKLDLGCGKNPKPGFIGVDIKKFGQDIVADLTKKWPWKDGTVDEIHASHFVEHLNAEQRIHFVNEAHRVLKPKASAVIITPHWASNRAYGDLTHQWPPVAEFWFYYLNKEWRAANAPHNDGYTCDFDTTWGYSLHPSLQTKHQEVQQEGLLFYKEAAQDMMATLVKR